MDNDKISKEDYDKMNPEQKEMIKEIWKFFIEVDKTAFNNLDPVKPQKRKRKHNKN
jgi:ribonucleotide reductase beta subunit family protein with ferritin-like domain